MKAVFFNLSAWTMLPVMDGFAKYLSQSLPILQITWARYFFTVFIVLPLMLLFFKKNLIFSKRPTLQIIRGVLLLVANILFFYAISEISLSKALTLAFIAPLIVTALSPLMLGEKVNLKNWLAVLFGFLGCLIVIRPGLVEFNLASFAAIGTGVFYGFYIIVTSKLSSSDNPLLTLLFTGVVGAIIISFTMPFVWVSPSNSDWIFLFLVGLFASIGHLFLILSLKYAKASSLAPYGYFEIIPNIIISYYFFGNFPDIFHFLGLLIIIISGIFVFKSTYNYR